jgi:hypothetical protein
VDQIIGKSYKAVNYDYKNDKVVAFGECIYQYPNNSTNSTTLPVDPPKQEYRSCVIAVDIRSGNVSQYWMADKDYDKIMPYAGAAGKFLTPTTSKLNFKNQYSFKYFHQQRHNICSLIFNLFVMFHSNSNVLTIFLARSFQPRGRNRLQNY